jgi:hypothetical protein
MNTTFALYLFTRLGPILAFAAIVLGVAVLAIVWLAIWKDDQLLNPDDYAACTKIQKRAAIVAAISAVVLITLPNKQDAAFILAGTGVIEAAKNPDVQRVAGKAAAVVEKALDSYLEKK